MLGADPFDPASRCRSCCTRKGVSSWTAHTSWTLSPTSPARPPPSSSVNAVNAGLSRQQVLHRRRQRTGCAEGNRHSGRAHSTRRSIVTPRHTAFVPASLTPVQKARRAFRPHDAGRHQPGSRKTTGVGKVRGRVRYPEHELVGAGTLRTPIAPALGRDAQSGIALLLRALDPFAVATGRQRRGA